MSESSGPALLSSQEVDDALVGLPAWSYAQNQITAEFTFKNFADAFGFMTRIAIEAEKRNHHPTWENTYNRVAVKLTTHDSGGVTELDFELARLMSQVAG